ncbi:MAG: alanine:cation symporter family protein [Erysipelotrichaceae bacterium]|nr:alanine:cation symporter family protein [Erysipelotrichaceae bacterium]
MEKINSIIWSISTVMLVLSGLYFAFKLDFLHLKLRKLFKVLKKGDKDSSGISPISSLMVSLGACIGVGSLAGIALSIYKGGVGTIFWILLSCIIVAPNSLVENTLAVVYHEKSGKDYLGGPAYYIKKGLGKKKLSYLYASLIIITYIFGFLTIQSNTIAKSLTTIFNIPNIIIGVIVGLLSFLIIFKGIKGISKFSNIFIPAMSLIYLLMTLLVVIKNISLLPSLIINIITSAFNFKALGWGMFSVIIIGVQRGIFSNEAGLGTASIASGSSNTKDAIKQGMISTLGVYFVTFVVCLGTALIILTSNYNPLNYLDVNGIEITRDALSYHLGIVGDILLYICIIAFSFSTIVSGYYYGESNLKFIFKNISPTYILGLKIITCFLLVLGSFISPTFLWNLVDILAGILAIINIYAIFSLRRDIIEEYLVYKRLL